MSYSKVMTVTSEIYNQDGIDVVTYFKFKYPLLKRKLEKIKTELDEDGDLLLIRNKNEGESIVKIEHKASTTLKLVGLQVWRGALLLADFIMHYNSLFRDKNILELGSGVGLTSIIAALYAKEVIATDIDEGGILDLITKNVSHNKELVKSKFSVLPLDFCNLNWNSELTEKIQTIDIILAADVIYDNDLTEAFVKTLTKILQANTKKKVYIALEKRYVFTVADLDTIAPCYEYFLEYIKSYWNHPPMSQWNFKTLAIDFKQYFEYERFKHLVIWEIST
ncbi:methyltransferase-like protein 22 isoform X2 [Lycorma delicatula]|uniref:methyltransferase-like protein 22 isoform X2 n=1 Tax=Lycorma delicatula TaxID=130591 RepID=UPI003F510719